MTLKTGFQIRTVKQSSIVSSFTYDFSNNTLDVKLTNNKGTYRYYSVPVTYWFYLQDCLNKDCSAGKAYNRLTSYNLKFTQLP